jgi:hypothetical protein
MSNAHRGIHLRLLRLWNQLEQHLPTDERQRVLLLQCRAIWELIDSMRLLVGKSQGVSAFILARSVFEYAAAVNVLANSEDQQVLTDYIDSGKLISYQVGRAVEAPSEWLADHQSEYELIRTRMNGRKWHGGKTTEDLIKKSDFQKALDPGASGLYKSFYKEVSSFSHGDSYTLLSHDLTGGWQLTFDAADRAAWGIRGLSLSYAIVVPVFKTVQSTFGMQLGRDFDALIPHLEALP